MLSIGRIGAGDGYKYLTSQVASQDAPRHGERLLGYYERTGHPPGQWVGQQADRFDLAGAVTEEPMDHLFGHCSHPTEQLRTSTGAPVLDADGCEVHVPLGRRMAQYHSVEERIKARVEAMNHPLTDDERSALAAAETTKGQPQAVTGFDLTFSAPKSVSILWALGGGRRARGAANRARNRLARRPPLDRIGGGGHSPGPSWRGSGGRQRTERSGFRALVRPGR